MPGSRDQARRTRTASCPATAARAKSVRVPGTRPWLSRQAPCSSQQHARAGHQADNCGSPRAPGHRPAPFRHAGSAEPHHQRSGSKPSRGIERERICHVRQPERTELNRPQLTGDIDTDKRVSQARHSLIRHTPAQSPDKRQRPSAATRSATALTAERCAELSRLLQIPQALPWIATITPRARTANKSSANLIRRTGCQVARESGACYVGGDMSSTRPDSSSSLIRRSRT